MYFALMGKLNARRKQIVKTEDDKGFTLIELLVVVIIIGILAAIAIPVYLGVQNNAKDSGVKSDLGNAKTAVIALQTSSANNALPTTAADLGQVTGITTAGFTQGANLGAPITYTANATTGTFCIVGLSTTNNLFYETDTLGVTAGGTYASPSLGTGCTKPAAQGTALVTPTK